MTRRINISNYEKKDILSREDVFRLKREYALIEKEVWNKQNKLSRIDRLMKRNLSSISR